MDTGRPDIFRSAISFSEKLKRWLSLPFFLLILCITLFFARDIIQLLATADKTALSLCIILSLLVHALASIEFRCMCSLLGNRLELTDAINTTSYGALLNTLPLPGSLLAKSSRMLKLGIPLRNIGKLTILTSILWLTLSALLAILMAQEFIILVPVCIVIISVTTYLIHCLGNNLALALSIVTCRAMIVFIVCYRLYLSMTAFDSSCSLAQASIISLSIPASSLLIFLPSVFGVTEAISAAIATFIRIEPRATFIASSFNRLAGLFFAAFSILLIHGYRAMKGIKNAE